MQRAPFAFLLSLVGCVRDTVPRLATPRSIVLREQTTIAAGAERVWDVLTDLPRYGEWNPWLVSAEGTLAPGGVVWARVWLNGAQRRAKHVVLAVEPRTRLCWRDAGWTTAFVYGQRCRELDALPDGTVRFRQELLLDGPFRATALKRYGEALRSGLAAETRALKARAEQAPR